MGVKILHCADLHLGSPFIRLPKQQRALRQNGQKEVFWNIIDLCREREVQLLLIAGDLFDSNQISSDLFHDVVRGFSSLTDTKVFIAAGNHDPLGENSVYKSGMFGENVHVFSGIPESVSAGNGVRVWGAGFCSDIQSQSLLDQFPPPADGEINIGVLHGDYPAAASDYNPITKSQIQRCGLDYLALGHIHTYSGILSEEKTYYAYSGAALGRGFDETGAKGVILGEIGKGQCDLKFVSLNQREYQIHRLNISGMYSDLEVVQEIQDRYPQQHFYRFILEGRHDQDYRPDPGMIRHILEEKGYMVDAVPDESEKDYDLEQLAQENTLRGVFVRQMLEKVKQSKQEEAQKYRRALELGLEAFDGEVDYIENH